ncbi:heterokaryon incompatibility protein-domain-containing protein [Cercophora samala]|uniref:Heterokaryon incompatibility protein-domain-containing protein n=1 Tax=Cercophora samala TaxID=330535 RepID=A0AA39Z9U4_9PEZI|nr:heterokaryon incompatibility protein-domain-containing protein [Cercophora samala]
MASSLYNRLKTNPPEIRLLDLLPSTQETAPLVCTLRTVLLSDASSIGYLALSYVWGNPHSTEVIVINGLPFEATTNLCAALHQVRLTDEPLTLWVDAICINQSDNTEKSEQIRTMKDIYQTAPVVNIWLGDGDEQSSFAIALIRLTAVLYTRSRNQAHDIPIEHQIMHDALTDHNLEALRAFFSKDWWRRIWVVQEAAVAQRAVFVCGVERLSFRVFASASFYWAALLRNPYLSTWRERVEKLEDIIRGTTSKVVLWHYTRFHPTEAIGNAQLDKADTLEEMLEESWGFDSTDPRDKVYALIGLLPHDDAVIVPDYNATIAQVYTGAVKAILEKKGSLSLISFTGSGDRVHRVPAIIDLPSWAPDLRRGVFAQTTWLRPKNHRASGSTKANATFSPDQRTLITDAVIAGRLCVVDEGYGEEDDGWLRGEKLGRWLYIILQNRLHLQRTASATGDSSDAFFRAISYSYFEADPVLDAQHNPPFIRKRNVSRLGFMAYVGYLDRFQDCVAWRLRCQRRGKPSPLYHIQGLSALRRDQSNAAVQVAPEHLMMPGPLRPQCLNRKAMHSPPPQPQWHDFANFRRFFELFDNASSALSSTTSPSVGALEYLMASFGPAIRPNVPSLLLSSTTDWPPEIEKQIRPVVADWVRQFVETFSQTSSNRSLLITNTGYVGLRPQASKKGDLVCVVKGCSLPIIATEHVLGDGWEVVGQAYVSDWMFGENLEGCTWREMRFK